MKLTKSVVKAALKPYLDEFGMIRAEDEDKAKAVLLEKNDSKAAIRTEDTGFGAKYLVIMASNSRGIREVDRYRIAE